MPWPPIVVTYLITYSPEPGSYAFRSPLHALGHDLFLLLSHVCVARAGFSRRPGRREGGAVRQARDGHAAACPSRACEYELADTGFVSGRVLPGLVLVASGDSLRA